MTTSRPSTSVALWVSGLVTSTVYSPRSTVAGTTAVNTEARQIRRNQDVVVVAQQFHHRAIQEVCAIERDPTLLSGKQFRGRHRNDFWGIGAFRVMV
ncbi:MAG: hypothetical protein M5U34_30215 [Chloroflexi bacterium]|nr:hypothetical protein [Chloroflexota bacterium]